MSSIRALTPRSCSSFKCRAPVSSIRTLLRAPNRPYHSYEHDDPPVFTPTEETILAAGLAHVPTHGFTSTALTLGTRDAGYPDVSTNLFPNGPFDLVRYHLVTQRLALKERIQFPHDRLGVGAKVRLLALERLRANQGIIHRWQEVSQSVVTVSRCDCTLLFFFPHSLARLLETNRVELFLPPLLHLSREHFSELHTCTASSMRHLLRCGNVELAKRDSGRLDLTTSHLDRARERATPRVTLSSVDG